MPATYTHHLVARETYKALPLEIQNKIRRNFPLYFFGAQGADFCFFDRSLTPKAKNLGSYLHRDGGYTTLATLRKLSVYDSSILIYALGYVTHYATDSTFHPYVYATAGKSPLRHSRLENILDIRFKKQSKSTEYDQFFRVKLSEEEKDLLFLIYTTVALRCELPSPQKPTFLRAISLFNAYLLLPNNIFDGYNAQIRSFAANEEKRAWYYPAAPEIISHDSADELFLKSVTLSTSLIENFLLAVKRNTPLRRDLFGKGFLTGI